MKRYASIRLVAAAALLIASGGCKDDNPGTGLNGPAVLAIQNAGAEPLQISLLEPKTQTIDIRAVARSVSAENLTVTFKVDRTLVDAYNKAHGIVPQTIRKSVRKVLEISHSAEEEKTTAHRKLTDAEREATIRRLEKEMKEASKMLEFEYAAVLRDRIIELRGEK